MDTDRISIARLLASGLPFTWQEAVAVCRAAAMVNDVDSAMNDRPPLVTPDTCFITRQGEIEFPETADHEAPEAMVLLLRAMLDGREAPDAIRAVASGRGSLDVLTALAKFPGSNPRGEIAALAVRALHQRTSASQVPGLAASTSAAPAARTATATPTARAMPKLTLAPTAAPTPTATPTLSPPPTPTPIPAPKSPAIASKPHAVVAPPRPKLDERPQVTPPPSRAENLELATTEELQALRRRSAATPVTRAMFVERLRQTAASFRSASTPLTVLALAALVSVGWWVARGAGRTVLEARPVSAGPLLSVALPPFAAAVASYPPATRGPDRPQVVTSGRPLLVDAASTPVGVAFLEAVPFRMPGPNSPSEPALALLAPAVPAVPPSPVANAPGDAMVAPPAATAVSVDDGATVFSAEDVDVVPPRLRRQQLPVAVREPGMEVPEGWPYLVLVVDPAGAVETVRLTARTLAPGQTLYRHRMLVAAAKAWQFAPAKKNGKAVRYAIRVALEP